MNKQTKIQKSIEAYKYIEQIGEELSNQCLVEIQPLLDTQKFKEAKKYVKTFFGDSYEDGYCIFIEADMIMAKINRLKQKFS